MNFTNTTTKIIEDIYLKLENLKSQLENEITAFTQEKVAQGWKKFHFFSSYYGDKDWYDDESIDYLFAPGVDVEQWDEVPFDHGSTPSQSHLLFKTWLSGLADDQYYEFDQED